MPWIPTPTLVYLRPRVSSHGIRLSAVPGFTQVRTRGLCRGCKMRTNLCVDTMPSYLTSYNFTLKSYCATVRKWETHFPNFDISLQLAFFVLLREECLVGRWYLWCNLYLNVPTALGFFAWHQSFDWFFCSWFCHIFRPPNIRAEWNSLTNVKE